MPGEVLDEGVGLRVGNHALNLGVEHGLVFELAGLGKTEQPLVRDAAPEKEAQPRRQRQGVELVRRAGRQAFRVLLDSEQELRRHEQALDGDLNPGIESRGRRTLLEEREQGLDIGRVDWATIGAPRERREDGPGALEIEVCRRLADEDLLPACKRLAGPARLIGTADLDAQQIGTGPGFGNIDARRVGPEERQSRCLVERGRSADERDDDVAPSGADRNPGFPALVRPVAGRPLGAAQIDPPLDLTDRRHAAVVTISVGLGVIGCRRRWRRSRPGARQREHRHPLTVDADLELLVLGIGRHAFVEITLQPRRDHIFRIDGERVADARAAARAVRHARQPALLRQVVRHAEVVDILERRRTPDGEPADDVGGP